MKILRPLPVLILVLLPLMMSTSAARGHGYIERTEPEDGAELDQSPEIINIWFNEPLQPDTGSVSIISGSGESIEALSVQHDPDDDTLITAEIPPNLPDAAYIVTVRAVVVSDGHEPTGSFVFWVGEKITAGTRNTVENTAPEQSSPAYGLVILFLGVMILSGATGYFWNQQQQELAILRPNTESDHFTLE